MACCGRRIKAAARSAPSVQMEKKAQAMSALDTSVVTIEETPSIDTEVRKKSILRKRMGAVRTK